MKKNNLLIKKKMCFITHYSELYGANRSLLCLIKYIKQQKNIEVLVLLPYKGQMEIELQEMEIKYKILKFYSLWYTKGSVFSFLKSIVMYVLNFYFYFLIKNKLDTFKPDLVYSNSSVINLGLWYARKRNIPHIWHFREFGDKDYGILPFPSIKSFRVLMNKSDAIISISKSIYENIVKNNVNDNILTPIIYNGVVSRFNIPKANVFLPTIITLGIVGTLTKEKNIVQSIILLQRLVKKKFINLRLEIIGEGSNDYILELKRKIDEFPEIKDKIKFIGFIIDSQKIYKNINILLMCSKNEAFGRVTAEAMSFGIPVIGFDNAGTSEIITNGHNGFLYSNIEDMEFYTLRLISDENLYRQFSTACQKTVFENFTTEIYGLKCYEVINNLLEKN